MIEIESYASIQQPLFSGGQEVYLSGVPCILTMPHPISTHSLHCADRYQ